MEIANLKPQSNGGYAWFAGKQKLALVYPTDGAWHTAWFDWCGERPNKMSLHCQSADDAGLAFEKYWPPKGAVYSGWLESLNGGYFRYSMEARVYVRKAAQGWYAVKTDGKLLGKNGNPAWFATAVSAFAAVQQQFQTPVDADPFRDKSKDWRWSKLKTTAHAA